jgi:hypothetical protein
MCDCWRCIRGGYTYSEAFRHACEVRFVVGLPTHLDRHSYLAGILEQRGELAYKRLREDVWTAMNINGEGT